MSKAKKVIFVIVEGPTDEDALSSVLKQIFSSAEVHFHVIHGDITTEDAITANNAKSYVAKRIAAEMKKYAYKESDILQIVHLIDTDGAFIPDNLVYSSCGIALVSNSFLFYCGTNAVMQN